MQVLDPNVVHGPTRRHQIGSILDLAVAVANIAFMFEVPLHSSAVDNTVVLSIVSLKYTVPV
jgi:hypothetical protein